MGPALNLYALFCCAGALRAGGAFQTTLALAIATKLPLREAAEFTNTVASVMVALMGTTGTASPGNGRAVWRGENCG